jgi:predicted small lipoprotein YifL
MRRRHAARAMAAALLALLAGCGQKGALYLPDQKPAAVTTPATAPTPAPASQPAAPAAPPKKSDSDKDGDAQPPQ